MLIDLKAKYLDLIVSAIEAAGHDCLHRPADSERGMVYVTATQNEGDTTAKAVFSYAFGDAEAVFSIAFKDDRCPPIKLTIDYVIGLDAFFKALRVALLGNRLEHKTEGKEVVTT